MMSKDELSRRYKEGASLAVLAQLNGRTVVEIRDILFPDGGTSVRPIKRVAKERDERLEEAAALLEVTNLSVTEVASEAGINPNSMSKLFKDYWGMTATEFRVRSMRRTGEIRE